jgi:O-antigen biosynthesis protein WbqV
MHEILFADQEPVSETGIDGVMAAKPNQPSMDVLRGWLTHLQAGIADGNQVQITSVLKEAIPEFRAEAQ